MIRASTNREVQFYHEIEKTSEKDRTEKKQGYIEIQLKFKA